MKYLILLAVLVVAWVLFFKGRRRPPAQGRADVPPQAAPMRACAHCGVHVPVADAVIDAAGRPFCGEAHRLAGPRRV